MSHKSILFFLYMVPFFQDGIAIDKLIRSASTGEQKIKQNRSHIH